MRERPILFSGPMVRALLDGRKTQTRRVVKCPHKPWKGLVYDAEAWTVVPHSGGGWRAVQHDGQGRIIPEISGKGFPCPYGAPGDRLWVKESLLCAPWQHRHDAITYAADHAFAWDADEPATWVWSRCGLSSLFMPRGLSRLTLTLTDVRVERVTDISTHDLEAEGISIVNNDAGARNEYRELWESLNASRGYGWDANPWVWVLTFSVADCAAAGRVAA